MSDFPPSACPSCGADLGGAIATVKTQCGVSVVYDLGALHIGYLAGWCAVCGKSLRWLGRNRRMVKTEKGVQLILFEVTNPTHRGGVIDNENDNIQRHTDEAQIPQGHG